MTVVEDEQEQPLSPFSRMMHVPGFNICVIGVLGFATTIDVVYFKKCLEQTLMNFPRASSVLVIKNEKKYDYWWKRTTTNVDDHVIVPDLDPNVESPDRFVEDYTTRISENPFDFTKPLWGAHVLNLKTSDANATVIFRIHHSIGDGVALISLLLASAKKISDPESLPELPSRKKAAAPPPTKGLVKRMFSSVWMMVLMFYYTLLDTIMIAATLLCIKDSESPIKGPPVIEQSAKRYVHRIISLEDVKLIKNAMNVTINDVLLGVTEAGLSKYLRRRYGKLSFYSFLMIICCFLISLCAPEIQSENGAKVRIAKHRITACIAFNLRVSSSIEELGDVILKGKKLDKGKWGNRVAIMLIPLRVFDDPLNYVRFVKAYMDKRKLSMQPLFQYLLIAFGVKLFGVKAAVKLSNKLYSHVSVAYSNVVGPQDEILLFGHPLNYIAPTVSGYPGGFVVHYQSYAKKLSICLAADEKLIPDLHEVLDCLQSSFKDVKDEVIKRGLAKDFN